MDDSTRRYQLGFRVVAMVVLDRLAPVFGMNPELWMNQPAFNACPAELQAIESAEYDATVSFGGVLYKVIIDLYRIGPMVVSATVLSAERVGVSTLQDRMFGELALDCLDALTAIGFRILIQH